MTDTDKTTDADKTDTDKTTDADMTDTDKTTDGDMTDTDKTTDPDKTTDADMTDTDKTTDADMTDTDKTTDADMDTDTDKTTDPDKTTDADMRDTDKTTDADMTDTDKTTDPDMTDTDKTTDADMTDTDKTTDADMMDTDTDKTTDLDKTTDADMRDTDKTTDADMTDTDKTTDPDMTDTDKTTDPDMTDTDKTTDADMTDTDKTTDADMTDMDKTRQEASSRTNDPLTDLLLNTDLNFTLPDSGPQHTFHDFHTSHSQPQTQYFNPQLPQPPNSYTLERDLTAMVRQVLQQNRQIIINQGQIMRELEALKRCSTNVPKPPPQFSPLDDDFVSIGSQEANVMMSKANYLKAYDSVRDGKELALKLMAVLFTKEELSASNFNGSVEHGKACLRSNYRFRAIVAQAELQYPGSTSTEEAQRLLRNAVNGKCRKSK